MTARVPSIAVIAALLAAGGSVLAAPPRNPKSTDAPLAPRVAAHPPTFEQVPGFRGVAQVSAGFGRACARMQSGTVECWGSDPSRREKVAGLDKVIDVAVSDDFACALTNDLDVKCWGSNRSGQLGDGSTVDHSTPVAVTGVANATAIGVGLAHACALLEDGTARCWGANGSGETGDGSRETPRSTPVAVRGLGKTTQMALARANRTSCARLDSGDVRCWGRVGREDSSTPTSIKLAGKPLDHVAQIAVALDTFCARMEDATVRCWGGNYAGQAGDGRTKDIAEPSVVEGLSDVVDVVPGADHSCALLKDGALACWGGLEPSAESGGPLPPVPLASRITVLRLPQPKPKIARRVQRFALVQTPNAELSLYAVADDGTLWWVAAPERRVAGTWLGLDEGGPFTKITFRSTPNGFGSAYDGVGTAPDPVCKSPRCASKSGEQGEYAVRGKSLVLSSRSRTGPDVYRFELSTSILELSAEGFSAPFRFIRACDSTESCDTFDLSRPAGKGSWKCESERCFWVGAGDKKKPK